ncbi:MAG: cobalamin-dependent protein [Proteobacteria bacterium]|nr:cobalamin-dependent protein [Pseudomonadota bacterium]
MSVLTNGRYLNGSQFALGGGCPGSEFADAKTGKDGSRSSTAGRNEKLRRTIESEIIPRLMLACAAERDGAMVSGVKFPSEVDGLEEFTRLLLDGSPDDVSSYVQGLMSGGESSFALLLDLFAPAARRLGEMWTDDERNFAEVTVAMGALQHAMRIVSRECDGSASGAPSGRKILLTPCSGEQHSFAVQILEAFFLRRGWQVEALLSFDQSQLVRLARKHRVNAIGLSVSQECLLDQLASDIQSLRRKCSNPSLVVLVGGRIFTERPDLVAQVGADASASDARSAVAIADWLVPESATLSL